MSVAMLWRSPCRRIRGRPALLQNAIEVIPQRGAQNWPPDVVGEDEIAVDPRRRCEPELDLARPVLS